jgi:hypothetical protein
MVTRFLRARRITGVMSGDCNRDVAMDRRHLSRSPSRPTALAVVLATLLSAVSVAPAFVPCPGDCGNDNRVTIDEILVGVSIALGAHAVGSCPNIDADGNSAVTVDEILLAINNALTGCGEPGILASGIQFVPDTIESVGEPASRLLLAGDQMLFNDGSEQPIKALSLRTRHIRPLVRQMGVPEDVEVNGSAVYWTEARSGFGASGCAGPGVIRVVNRTALGSAPQTETLARSDNCGGAPGQLIVDGLSVYWIASLVSPPTYMIMQADIGGGSPREITRTGQPIVALAKDSTHIYWLEGFLEPGPSGVLKRIRPDGSGEEVVLSGIGSSGSIAGNLLLDGNDAIVTSFVSPAVYQLLRVPVSGGTPRELTTLPDRPRALTVSGSQIYLVDDTALRSVPLAGGAPTVVVDDVISGVDLSVTDGAVVWSETVCCAHGQKGRVRKLDLDGGGVTTLAQDVDAPGGLTAAGGWVYWAEGGVIGLTEGTGRLAATPLTGGAVTTLAQGVDQPLPMIVADATRVYFADRFRIKSVSIAGGVPETLATGDFYVSGIASDGERVYWTEEPLATVRSVGVTGGEVQTLATGSGPSGLIRVSGGYVYWTESFDRILRGPKGGGTVETVAAQLPFLSDLAVDSSGAYFSENDSGSVRRAPLNGGSFALIGTGLPFSWNVIALDAHDVYWVDQSDLWRASKAGGMQVRIASELNSDAAFANGVVSDGSFVYWSEVRGGTLRYAPVR